MTTTSASSSSSLLGLHAAIARELGPRPRARHGLGLLTTVTAAVALLTLWATEPALPLRTQLAFGALLGLDLVWAAFFARVLFYKQAWFGHPRVEATTIGLGASLLWLVFAVGVVVTRDAWPMGWAAIATAASFVVLAGALRHQAVREVERLRGLARELETMIAA